MEEEETSTRPTSIQKYSKTRRLLILALTVFSMIHQSYCNIYTAYSLYFIGAILPQVGVITEPSTVQQEQVTMKIYTQIVTSIPADGRVEITLPAEMSISKSTFTCNLVLNRKINFLYRISHRPFVRHACKQVATASQPPSTER